MEVVILRKERTETIQITIVGKVYKTNCNKIHKY